MKDAHELQIERRCGSLPPIRGSSFVQAALIALALTLACAEPARAGTMHVYSCHTLSGHPAGISGWTIAGEVPRGNVFTDCAGPLGAMYLQIGPGNSEHPGFPSWSFSAAPNTAITGVTTAACFRAPIGGVAGMGWPHPTPWKTTEAPWVVTTVTEEWGCNGGRPYWKDGRNVFTKTDLSTPRVHFTIGCVFRCLNSQAQASVEISSFRADIRDDSAPAVTTVRGPLASNLSHTGTEYVEFDVVDRGVGVYRAVIEARLLGRGNWVERSTVALGRARPSCVELDVTAHLYEFDDPQPCPLNVTGARVEFNADSLPHGEHEFRIHVEDASGNRSPVITPRKFFVTGPSAAAALVPGGRSVMLRIAGAARRTVKAGASPVLRGTLTEVDGRPLGGLSLAVRGRPFLPKPGIGSGDWTVLGQLVTGADGSFSARIPAGPSRVIQVMRDNGEGMAAAAANVDVVVPASVSVRARSTRIRNGQSAVFTGRVKGPIPAGGVLVALEVREPGRWIPVATTRRWVRTNAAGRYRLAYRFRRTFQLSTYRFRVVAAEDSAFEYSRGVSRTIDVRVKP